MHDMLTESITAILADCCAPAVVRDVVRDVARSGVPEAGQPLWRQLEEAGFISALLPETAGGSGLSLMEAAGVFFSLGRYAVPLPVAQTMMARRVLSDFDVQPPDGPIAFAVASTAASDAILIPYGRVCERVMIQRAGDLFLIDIDAIEDHAIEDEASADHGDARGHGHHMRGSLDRVGRWRSGGGQRLVANGNTLVQPVDLLEMGALLTSMTMAGAMARILEMTVAYVNDREQFGRSIGKFQAVQHSVSVMAEHVVAATVAAQSACAAANSPLSGLRAALAKARTSRAAALIANTAHALTGAMGITAEYDLQLFTRMLHAQRLHFGSEAYWEEAIGEHALANWDAIVPGVVAMGT